MSLIATLQERTTGVLMENGLRKSKPKAAKKATKKKATKKAAKKKVAKKVTKKATKKRPTKKAGKKLTSKNAAMAKLMEINAKVKEQA